MVYRIYVEKREGLRNEAKALLSDVNNLLSISSLTDVRIINRYDAEDIDKELFDYAVGAVFSEPQLDIASPEIDTTGAYTFRGRVSAGTVRPARGLRRSVYTDHITG